LDAKIGTEAWIDKPNQDVDARTTYAQRFDVADVAAIQTYPTGAAKNMGRGMVERYGDRPGRAIDQPAFTLRASAGGTEPGGFIWDNGDGTTRKLETEEASVLQAYERPFIWCGTKTKKFLQIGNAVPPLFAEHILKALIGIEAGL
jgi:DNA (cytosine-5)-methyltransferase 1